jgi:hypothetical protein
MTSIVEDMERLGELVAEVRTAPPWFGLGEREWAWRTRHEAAALEALRAKYTSDELEGIWGEDFVWEVDLKAWPEPKVGDLWPLGEESQYATIHDAIEGVERAFDERLWDGMDDGDMSRPDDESVVLCAVYDREVIYTCRYLIDAQESYDFAMSERRAA